MLLPHTHHGLEMILASITRLREDFRPKHLWGKVLRIGKEILHQTLKIRGFGSGGKRGATPVVQHGSGKRCRDRGRELLDDQLAAAQAYLALLPRSQWSEEALLRPVLKSKARLDRTDIRVES